MTTPALVFIHIPKTAGTSMRSALESAVPAEKILHLYPTEWAVDPSTLPDLPAERLTGIELVIGHIAFGVHEQLPGLSTVYATIVRDPVEQLLSHYYHYVRAVDTGSGARSENRWQQAVASGLTLESFVKAEGGGGKRVFQNRQTWTIAGQPRKMDRDDPTLLKRAKRNIKRYFSAVGTTQDPDALARGIAEVMGWSPPAPIPTLNVNPNRPTRDSLPAEVVREIEDLNRLDAELFHHVENLVEEGRAVRPLDRVTPR